MICRIVPEWALTAKLSTTLLPNATISRLALLDTTTFRCLGHAVIEQVFGPSRVATWISTRSAAGPGWNNSSRRT
jgi:hypothetical protein